MYKSIVSPFFDSRCISSLHRELQDSFRIILLLMYMATTEMHRVCLKNSPTLLKIVMSDFDDISQLAEIFNTVYSYFRCPVWKEKLVKNAKTYMKT